MASTRTARVPAGKLDDDMRRCGRAIVRVPGCKCEFSVEPGKVIFHDGEGMNYVMYPERDFERDAVLCRVDTPRYRATATQVGYCGEAEFTVTANWGSTPVPTPCIVTSPAGDSHDDFLDASMGCVTSYMRGFGAPYTTLNRKRKKVLLLCH